jgi:hypothetical protein
LDSLHHIFEAFWTFFDGPLVGVLSVLLAALLAIIRGVRIRYFPSTNLSRDYVADISAGFALPSFVMIAFSGASTQAFVYATENKDTMALSGAIGVFYTLAAVRR